MEKRTTFIELILTPGVTGSVKCVCSAQLLNIAAMHKHIHTPSGGFMGLNQQLQLQLKALLSELLTYKQRGLEKLYKNIFLNDSGARMGVEHGSCVEHVTRRQ